MKHIVALSGGKDSTAMALRLAEVEPRDYEYVFTPTGRELPPMVEHWQRLGVMLGKPLIPLPAVNSLGGLVYIQKALPNWRMRWCTRLLKIEPFKAYIVKNLPCTIYVGIRADEAGDREGVDYGEGVIRDYALVRWGWGLAKVLSYLDERKVCIPDRTDCDMCFFQTLWEWYQFWLNYPIRYLEIVRWEEFTGHTLRSAQRDSWPASLKELAGKFSAGEIPKQRQAMKDRKAMCSTCAR